MASTSNPSEPLAPVLTKAPQSVPPMIDFLYSVPSPVTSELVALSPYISYIRQVAEITSWRSSWPKSWLALATWWAICLLAYPGLRFFFPVILLCAIYFSRRRSWSGSVPPVTEQSLQAAISDLAAIRSLIPSAPTPPSTPIFTLFRVSAIIFPPYLFLTYFVSMRVLLGISGTMVLTWRAGWAQTMRSLIWRSAHIRWSLYSLWSYISGEPLPERIIAVQSESQSNSSKPINSIRFLFTIYENQRWWMGLDWTAALLPAERPSWCSAQQTSLPPPNAFTLPEPAVSYVNDRKGKRVKRIATWHWEEGEWKVMIKREGGTGVTRVERPVPSDEKETPSASKLLQAVGRRGSSIGGSPERVTGDQKSHEDEPFEGDEDEHITDSDGWTYGDNKWQGLGPHGGLGKYTRHRRWTRVAVLSETIDTVDAGDSGVVQELDEHLKASQIPTSSSAPEPVKDDSSSKDSNRNMLRQRLKAAVDGPGH